MGSIKGVFLKESRLQIYIHNSYHLIIVEKSLGGSLTIKKKGLISEAEPLDKEEKR